MCIRLPLALQCGPSIVVKNEEIRKALQISCVVLKHNTTGKGRLNIADQLRLELTFFDHAGPLLSESPHPNQEEIKMNSNVSSQLAPSNTSRQKQKRKKMCYILSLSIIGVVFFGDNVST